MNDLAHVMEFIARNEKQNAIPQLASLLLKNRDHAGAWFLLGELIDDPFRKKFCYQQVLRLIPNHAVASTRLKELEKPPAAEVQSGVVEDAGVPTKPSIETVRSTLAKSRSPGLYPPIKDQRDEPAEVVVYAIVGIAAFLILLYVILSGSVVSWDNTIFYISFLVLIIVAVLIAGSAGNKPWE
jgi:hypothetical protein